MTTPQVKQEQTVDAPDHEGLCRAVEQQEGDLEILRSVPQDASRAVKTWPLSPPPVSCADGTAPTAVVPQPHRLRWQVLRICPRASARGKCRHTHVTEAQRRMRELAPARRRSATGHESEDMTIGLEVDAPAHVSG